MKTYIATARLAHGPLIEYEVEALSKNDANWHARRAAYADGHRGPIRFSSVEKKRTSHEDAQNQKL
jgi:hypothetical protein